MQALQYLTMNIGRPESNEAASYYFIYIDQVAGDDPLATIERQLEDTLTLFSGISEEQSLMRYAPDKWTIRQVLSHICDTERMMAFRIFWFARGFDSALPSFDQHICVAGAAADRIPLATHLEEFRQVRLSTILLLRNLPAEAWSRGGIASDNFFTVRAIAFTLAGHEAHHVRIVRERYLKGTTHREQGTAA